MAHVRCLVAVHCEQTRRNGIAQQRVREHLTLRFGIDDCHPDKGVVRARTREQVPLREEGFKRATLSEL